MGGKYVESRRSIFRVQGCTGKKSLSVILKWPEFILICYLGKVGEVGNLFGWVTGREDKFFE
jgi:hypothetical protein